MNRLAWLDWLVIAAYFALVFFIAWLYTRRERVRESSGQYFLAVSTSVRAMSSRR